MFYYYSPVRRKELKEMAKEIEVEFEQLRLLKNIRWLASRSRGTEYFGVQLQVYCIRFVVYIIWKGRNSKKS